MKLLFVGDSITGWSDLTQWLKFSHIVECMLAARWSQANVMIMNRGIAGNSTADLLARLQTDVLDPRPDVIVMLIGGNDSSAGLPRERTAANLEMLLQRITAVCPRVLLLQYHLLVWGDCPDQAWTQLVKNNDLIAAAARRHACPLLDMGAPMRAAVDDSVPVEPKDFRDLRTWNGKPGYRTCDLVGPDGVHLNCAGEIVYGRAIFERLVELAWLDDLGNPTE